MRSLVRNLHPILKRRIRAALSDLLSDPTCGKPLKGELEGYWTLRVGRHRIVYRPDADGLEIVAIGPRRTIYEEAARSMLKRRRRRRP